jgi:hypothetical protein
MDFSGLSCADIAHLPWIGKLHSGPISPPRDGQKFASGYTFLQLGVIPDLREESTFKQRANPADLQKYF